MESTYPYKPRLSGSLLGILLFIASAVFLGFRAATNERTLIINRMFYLSPENARTFYGVFSGFAILIALVMIGFLIIGSTSNRRIRLTGDQVITPKNFINNAVVAIPYRTILKLQVNTLGRHRMLVITYATGNVTILESFLPDKRSFDELYGNLSEKLR